MTERIAGMEALAVPVRFDFELLRTRMSALRKASRLVFIRSLNP